MHAAARQGLRKLTAEPLCKLLLLTAQTAQQVFCRRSRRALFLLLDGKPLQCLLLCLHAVPQCFACGKLRVQSGKLPCGICTLLPRLLLAYAQLRLCIFIGRLLRKRLHLRDQLLLFLREGGVFRACVQAFRVRPLLCRIACLLRFAKLFLGRGVAGRVRRRRMVHRTAYRARHALRKLACENTGLRVKEGAAALAVCCVRLLRRVLRTQIRLLRGKHRLLRRPALAQQRVQCAQFSFTLLRFCLLCAQLFALCVQSRALLPRFAVCLQRFGLRRKLRGKRFLPLLSGCKLFFRVRDLLFAAPLRLDILRQRLERGFAVEPAAPFAKQTLSVSRSTRKALMLLLPCCKLRALRLMRALLLYERAAFRLNVRSKAEAFLFRVFKLSIARQLVFEVGKRALTRLLLRLLRLLGGKRRFRLFGLPALHLLLFPIFLECFAHLFSLVRLDKPRIDRTDLLLQHLKLPCAGRILRFVAVNERFEQLHGLREREFSLLRLLGLFAEHITLRADDAADILLYACARRLTFSIKCVRAVLQTVLQHLVAVRLEDLAEYLLPVLCLRCQQLEKFALRDHGDLRKLAAVEADDLRQFCVDLLRLVEHAAVRQMQLRLGSLLCHFAAASGRALVFRVSPDGIDLSAAGKRHFDEGRRFRRRILGTEHGCIAVRAARRVVQRIGDRVEDRGLACARIAGDQVQPLLAQLFQIDLGVSRIRAECGQCKFQRSHLSSSQMLAISLSANACCSSLIGVPFWLS